jgi:hypothetical protein
MMRCVECGTKAGKHHIIFKGNKSIIVYLPINELELCNLCHKKIHKDKEMDLKYKKILLNKLRSLFPNEYYDLESIKKLLKLSNMQLKIFSNNVKLSEFGYTSNDIIIYFNNNYIY